MSEYFPHYSSDLLMLECRKTSHIHMLILHLIIWQNSPVCSHSFKVSCKYCIFTVITDKPNSEHHIQMCTHTEMCVYTQKRVYTHMHTQAHMSMHGMLQSAEDLSRHLESQPCRLRVSKALIFVSPAIGSQPTQSHSNIPVGSGHPAPFKSPPLWKLVFSSFEFSVKLLFQIPLSQSPLFSAIS